MKNLGAKTFWNHPRKKNSPHKGVKFIFKGLWGHFWIDFHFFSQNWNQQACLVLVISLVLFRSTPVMYNLLFCLFDENLGLSQKITLWLSSQHWSCKCKFPSYHDHLHWKWNSWWDFEFFGDINLQITSCNYC